MKLLFNNPPDTGDWNTFIRLVSTEFTKMNKDASNYFAGNVRWYSQMRMEGNNFLL